MRFNSAFKGLIWDRLDKLDSDDAGEETIDKI
jgi:hypothetical protein